MVQVRIVVVGCLILGVLGAGPPAAAQEGSSEAAVISGTVTNDLGVGIAELCVTAWAESPAVAAEAAGSVTTDSMGGYWMEVAPGELRVAFFDCSAEPIYAWEWWNDAALYSQAPTVTVADGEHVANINAALSEGNSIDALALDADGGGAVPGACGVLLDADHVIVGVQIADSWGEMQLTGVRPGQHYFAFVDCNDEPQFAIEWHKQSGNHVHADVLDVGPWPEYVDVIGRMHRAGGISGQVTDARDGSGVADACVFAYDSDGIAHRAVMTGSDGVYALGLLRPGGYQIGFYDCSTELRYDEQWYAGQPSFEQGTTVSVASAMTTTGVNAAMAPASVEAPAGPGQAPTGPAPDDSGDPGDGSAEACPEGTVPDSGFSDVSASNLHRASIDCIVWWRIASGRSATEYAPSARVTRAQMATFLVRVMEQAQPVPTSDRRWFNDIGSNPHAENINKLAAAGIVSGTGPGTYSPDRTVTRAQMATFLVRAYEHVTGTQLPTGGDRFSDDNGNLHEDSINKAVEAGFTGGLTASTYGPDVRVRRDQMATFLARTLERLTADGHVAGSGVVTAAAVPPLESEVMREGGPATEAGPTVPSHSPLATGADASGDGVSSQSMIIGGTDRGWSLVPVSATVSHGSCQAGINLVSAHVMPGTEGSVIAHIWTSRYYDGTWYGWAYGGATRHHLYTMGDYVGAAGTTKASVSRPLGYYQMWVQVIRESDGRTVWNGKITQYANLTFNSATGRYDQRSGWYCHSAS